MPGLRIKVNSPILPILTLKLVAMTTSLELSKKGVKSAIYDQIPTIRVKILLKIGPVDKKSLCSEVYLKKN